MSMSKRHFIWEAIMRLNRTCPTGLNGTGIVNMAYEGMGCGCGAVKG